MTNKVFFVVIFGISQGNGRKKSPALNRVKKPRSYIENKLSILFHLLSYETLKYIAIKLFSYNEELNYVYCAMLNETM